MLNLNVEYLPNASHIAPCNNVLSPISGGRSKFDRKPDFCKRCCNHSFKIAPFDLIKKVRILGNEFAKHLGKCPNR